MARPLRITAADLTYHVTARGTGRMCIFRDDHDRLAFLDRLADVVETCRVDCHAYCLMATHYHLVMKTPEANVSRAIHRLNGCYAQWWNHRHERVGHVFQGRFGAQVIQDDTYLLAACRYVVLNPVRAGVVRAPGDWPWSSYRATAALAEVPLFLRPQALWWRLGDGDGGPDTAAARYRQFVCEESPGASLLPSSPILGADDFVEQFKVVRELASREIRRAERQPPPTLDRLFAHTVTREARGARAAEAFRLGYRMAEIARYLSVHPSTVSKMIDAARVGSGREKAAHSRSDPRVRS